MARRAPHPLPQPAQHVRTHTHAQHCPKEGRHWALESVTQEIFTEHLLCARHSSGCWESSTSRTDRRDCPWGPGIPAGGVDSDQDQATGMCAQEENKNKASKEDEGRGRGLGRFQEGREGQRGRSTSGERMSAVMHVPRTQKLVELEQCE